MNAKESTSRSPRSDQPLATRLRGTILRTGRRLRASSAGALSEGQVSVLAWLSVHGAQSAGELAEREHVRPPTMTRTLKFLEEQGYLVRTEDPQDRRSALIELSAQGEDYIRQTRRRRDQWLQQRLDELSAGERQILSEAEEILRKVVEG